MSSKSRSRVWCAAFNCRNTYQKANLSFFRFPKDEERCKQWVIRCRLKNLENKSALMLYNGYRLCADHFEDSQFMNATTKDKLIHSALPSQFLMPNPPAPVTVKRRLPERCHLPEKRSRQSQTNSAKPPRTRTLVTHDKDASTTDCVMPVQELDAAGTPQSSSVSVVNIAEGPTSSLEPSCSNDKLPTTTNMTPRKRKLIKNLRSQSVQLCRLRKRLKTVDGRVSGRVKTLSPNKKLELLLSDMSHFLDGPQLQFVAAQLRFAGRAKHGRRWSDADKLLALSIYYSSSKAYKFLGKIFHLPSISSLRKWIHSMEQGAGFNDRVFQILGKKLSLMRDLDRLCVIALDEMSVKVGLKYLDSRDVIFGFEDSGSSGGKTKNAADQALVFIVRGMVGKWKQPVGYFFSSGPTKAGRLKELLFETISNVFSCGGQVKAVICDQGSTNRAMFANLLGVSVDRPYFVFNFHNVDHCIYCFFDPPHLLKSLRNNFLKHNIEIGTSLIQFAHVKAFYDQDSKMSVRMCPKLSHKHIDLTNFSKMRVRPAAQLLSHSVAAGLMTYASLGAIDCDAQITAEFIDRADKLFDTFNSRTLLSKLKPHKGAISQSSVHISFLKDCLQWFSDMKFVGTRGNLPCIDGWKLTISALLSLWTDVHENYGLKFLLTCRLNQDCLENFFAVIRQAGICRDNPTPFEFSAAFNHAMVNVLLRPPPNCNCAYDGDLLIANLQNFSDSPLNTTINLQPNVATSTDIIMSEVNVKAAVISSLPLQNTLYYIAGYVACKLIKSEHKCCAAGICNATSLISGNRADINTEQMFTHHKALAKKKVGEFGGLTLASDQLFAFISRCEEIFVQSFDGIAHQCSVRSRLNRMMMTDTSCMLPLICDNLKLCIVMLYNKVRIHAAVKFVNSYLSMPNAPRKDRKMLKILHL